MPHRHTLTKEIKTANLSSMVQCASYKYSFKKILHSFFLLFPFATVSDRYLLMFRLRDKYIGRGQKALNDKWWLTLD